MFNVETGLSKIVTGRQKAQYTVFTHHVLRLLELLWRMVFAGPVTFKGLIVN